MPSDTGFGFGSTIWPGLSKLMEECGEVVQVGGKLMGTGGEEQHWEGSNLRERMEEELGDLTAAVAFVIDHQGLDFNKIEERARAKRALFEEWHKEGDPLDLPTAYWDCEVCGQKFLMQLEHSIMGVQCPGGRHATSDKKETEWFCAGCSRTFKTTHEAQQHEQDGCRRSQYADRPILPASTIPPAGRRHP